ncbi:hypothetical protein N9M66_04205 [Litoreibacter sp.]|nr:hypothetical protein [Litoreibacter sp.]
MDTTFMSSSAEQLEVQEVEGVESAAVGLDILVFAAGFEDRSSFIIDNVEFSAGASCLLIKYVNDIDENTVVFEHYVQIAQAKFSRENIHIVDLNTDDIEQFSRDLEAQFKAFSPELRSVGVDVSGMTAYAICLALKYSRKYRPFEKQRVFYTSAAEYIPTHQEYESLIEKQSGDEIAYIPKSMAMEMSDNLVVEAFSGHRSGDARTCLAIFAGYEVHRSSGTIDAINPSLLLIMYGLPGDGQLAWRTDLSKKLHAKFETTRRCATEDVSTLFVQESLDLLERYYNYLIDDYDLVLAPICSKMHSIAAYMFWERYGEIQLSFPLPIGYNISHRPRGIGKAYFVDLYEQRMLFRDVATIGAVD